MGVVVDLGGNGFPPVGTPGVKGMAVTPWPCRELLGSRRPSKPEAESNRVMPEPPIFSERGSGVMFLGRREHPVAKEAASAAKST